MFGQWYYIQIKLVMLGSDLPQGFTICDALLLEEYLSVSLCELYDWAKSK